MAANIKMALRNLSRQKGRTSMLMVAIGFGVMVVTLLNSFTTGIVDNVQGTVSRMLGGHIYITGQKIVEDGRIISGIPEDNELTNIIAETGIRAEDITRRSLANATIIFGSSSATQRIEGVDWDEEKALRSSLTVVKGDLASVREPSSLIVTEKVADQLNVRVGDQVIVKLQTVTGQQNVGDFVIGAVITDPGVGGMLSAYADLGYLNGLLNLDPQAYQQLSIFLRNPATMEEDAARIYSGLTALGPVYPRDMGADAGNNILGAGGPGVLTFLRGFSVSTLDSGESPWQGIRYRITTLNDLTTQIQDIVSVLNSVSLVVLIVLMIIVMVAITNTFRMIVSERTHQYIPHDCQREDRRNRHDEGPRHAAPGRQKHVPHRSILPRDRKCRGGHSGRAHRDAGGWPFHIQHGFRTLCNDQPGPPDVFLQAGQHSF